MGTFLPTLESLASAADQSPFIQKLKQAAIDTGKDAISASAPVIAHRVLQQTGVLKPGELYPGETTIKQLPAAMTMSFLGAGGAEEPLAAEHPEVSSRALEEHANTGGSTYNPRTGQSLAGSRNFAVGVAPEHTAVFDQAPTPRQYSDFAATHRDLLARNPNLHIGSYVDPDTGVHSLEIVAATPSKQAAGALGARLGEGHVYNLATDEKIPTGVDPSLQRSPVTLPLEDRLTELDAAAPKRSPYSGTHFSDSKFDLIDGSRRGATAANGTPTGESARLRLGSSTGMGKDAPPGFYTYHAGALPDPAMAAKPNAYNVRGQYAFATTDDPVFQNGYRVGQQWALDAGADPKMAHQLGLNAAEHAVRDAGYDGYYSPKHPGVRFHFGDAVAKPVGPLVDPDLGPEPVKTPDAEKPNRTTINGSGESSGSAEAISRAASDKAKGVRYSAIDTRSGIRRPLIGVDALDVQPNPFEVVVRHSPEGDIELARGKHAR